MSVRERTIDLHGMHIAIIGSIGSARSVHVLRWANALAERGFRITLITMHKGLRYEPEHLDKITIIRLPFPNPWGYIANIPWVRKILSELNPDLVHSFYALGHGFLGRMSGKKPYLISVLGSDIFDDIHKREWYKQITKKNLERADAVGSTSHVMAEEIKKLCGDEFPVHITPFGIDTDLFPYVDRSVREYNSEIPFRFGTVKWLEPKYGVDILIQAFARFMTEQKFPNAELVIVGDGSQRKSLAQLALHLGVSKYCRFTGSVSHRNVPFHLETLDIYLALSQLNSESFGVAILEASSTGLPVIVSDVGGLPEVVNHGQTGYVVPRQNMAEIVNQMKKLYISDLLRLEMGSDGRTLVLNKYEWEHSVDIMIDIYESLI